MRPAVLILSAAGLKLARKLGEGIGGDVLIYGPSCVVESCRVVEVEGPRIFNTEAPNIRGWAGPLRLALPEIWREHDAIVAVMALGIVVRLVGPLAADKRSDPAVVAVDEAGRFAISVLGGHGQGANDLARAVANAVGAQAVITTASEAHGLPAVDLIGRELGWCIERAENLTRVAAAVVRGEAIGVIQETGSTDWWRRFGAWPATFQRLDVAEDPAVDRMSAVLFLSDRAVPAGLPADRTLVYRPPSLVAGIGCRRGVSAETIGAFVAQVFAEHGLALASLAKLATVDLKRDEPGLIAFAAGRGIPVETFTRAELDGWPGVERPSEAVRARIGIAAVAEPAALRASGAARLLVPKQKGPGVTVAVARRADQRT